MSQSRKRDLDEGMLTPPSTPKRTRRKTRQNIDLSPSNQPTNETLPKSQELLDCFITSISHRECCPEGGNFVYHKGINPGYPKGHYCCQNVCMSSDQELSIKYIAPYFVIYGLYGPLGCLSAEESDTMRRRIGELGGDCAVEISVTGFSCFKDEITLKRVSGDSPPIKYSPCSAAWRITISFYSPIFSPLSPRLLTWGEEPSGWNIAQESSLDQLDGRITPPSRSLLVELPSPFSRPTTPTPSLGEMPSFCLCTSPHRYLSHSKRHTLSTR